MKTYCYTVTLDMQTPMISQASGGRAYGLDTAALYADDEKMVLPGSLVRGALRHAWEFFATDDTLKECGLISEQINHWLGQPSPSDTDNLPLRACLHFSQYWKTSEQVITNGVLHRIQIDAEKGRVKKGALQVIETPFASGKTVQFCGEIHASLQDKTEANHLKHWLFKGFQFIPALGALKGIGFGKVLTVTVAFKEKEKKESAYNTLTDPDSNGFGIVIYPQAPFCISRHHIRGNRFESEDFIPGSVIKGILAQQKENQENLNNHFDDIRITHAYPVHKNSQQKRPLAMPLSLVIVDNKVYDVALCANPGLIHNYAPAFSIDWKPKQWEIASKVCGLDELPPRSIIVRTAVAEEKSDTVTENRTPDKTKKIGKTTGTAEEGALFATETIEPTKYAWLANVDCSNINEQTRQKVVAELQDALSQGLFNLGKTKAYADVSVCQFFQQPMPQLIRDNKVVIVLQSAAHLLPDPYRICATNGGDQLKAEYRKTWDNLSDHSLKLSHFYARQQLVGGSYLYRRFWQDKPYNPALLTVAGSVFVFEVQDEEKAESILQKWLTHGLPQLNIQDKNWQTNQFIAENGYGEILVNLEIHWDLDPETKGVWCGLS